MTEKLKKKEEKTNAQMAPEIIRSILQKGVDFEVTVNHKNIFHRFKIVPVSRTFIVHPINLGTLFNISEIILKMKDIDPSESGDYFMTGIESISENKNKMLEIIALGILNRRITGIFDRIEKWRLKRFFDSNINAYELLNIVRLIIEQMDVTAFLASIVSIKKRNLVEAKKEMTKEAS